MKKKIAGIILASVLTFSAMAGVQASAEDRLWENSMEADGVEDDISQNQTEVKDGDDSTSEDNEENTENERATYEGYGPNGVAIIVETLTDNKNRTASNVRNAFTKGYGSIGTQGCVSYMFDQKGQIIIDKEECEMDADEIMMLALDAGAEDFSEEEDSYEILTAPDDFSAVREALEKAGLPIAEAQVAMIPQTYVELTDEQALKDLQRTLDLLDDDDDVTDYWTNWDEQ